jgi:hypothetical protein
MALYFIINTNLIHLRVKTKCESICKKRKNIFLICEMTDKPRFYLQQS